MPIPAELDTSVQEALQSVRSNVKHDFNWQLRQGLYETLDTVCQLGIKRTRGWLALIAAENVFPIFMSVASNDLNSSNLYPQKLLRMAKGILEGSVNQEEAAQLLEDAYHSSDIWGSINDDDDFDFAANYAAIAAYKALLEVSSDRDQFSFAKSYAKRTRHSGIVFFGGQAPTEGWITGESFTDFDWAQQIASGDTAGTAAVAFSRRSGSNHRDAKKLKDFWEWWLLEALPWAWKKGCES
jgi:hypothetical protein